MASSSVRWYSSNAASFARSRAWRFDADAPFGGRVALVAERDPRFLGQALDRLGELEVLDVAQEPDRVPALATAEAVVQALRG